MGNKTNSQIRYDFYCFYNDNKVLEYSCHSEEKRNIKEQKLKSKNIRHEIVRVALF